MSSGSSTTILTPSRGPSEAAPWRVDIGGRAARRRSPLIQTALLVTVAVPAFVFLLGGIAKLDDPFLAAKFMSYALSMRLTEAFELTRVLAVGEIALALIVCLTVGRSRVPALAGMCLLAFFVGLLLRIAYQYPQAIACGCFGSLMGEFQRGSLWTQVGIDLGLFALLGLHCLLPSSARRPHSRAAWGRIIGRRAGRAVRGALALVPLRRPRRLGRAA